MSHEDCLNANNKQASMVPAAVDVIRDPSSSVPMQPVYTFTLTYSPPLMGCVMILPFALAQSKVLSIIGLACRHQKTTVKCRKPWCMRASIQNNLGARLVPMVLFLQHSSGALLKFTFPHLLCFMPSPHFHLYLLPVSPCFQKHLLQFITSIQ